MLDICVLRRQIALGKKGGTVVALTRQEAKGTAEEQLWDTPDSWPRNVRYASLDALGKLGEDPATGALYWNGEPFMLRRRFEPFERALAVVGLIIAGSGAAAAIVQAAIAVMEHNAGH